MTVPNRSDSGALPRRPSLRDRWLRVLYATRRVSPAVALTLLAFGQDMQADGTVSVPATTIARRRNLSPRSVKTHVAAAIDAGVFDRVSRGYEGHTAVYKAVLPDRAGPRAGRQSAPSGTTREGEDFQHPLDDETLHPLESESSTSSAREGADSLPPSTKGEVMDTSGLAVDSFPERSSIPPTEVCNDGEGRSDEKDQVSGSASLSSAGSLTGEVQELADDEKVSAVPGPVSSVPAFLGETRLDQRCPECRARYAHTAKCSRSWRRTKPEPEEEEEEPMPQKPVPPVPVVPGPSRVDFVRCPDHVGVVDLPDCRRCVDQLAIDLLLEVFGGAGLPLPELNWHTEPADR